MSSAMVTVEPGERESVCELYDSLPDRHTRTVFLGPASDARKPSPRTRHPCVRPVQLRIQRTQQPRVYLQLVIDLKRYMMLPVNRRR